MRFFLILIVFFCVWVLAGVAVQAHPDMHDAYKMLVGGVIMSIFVLALVVDARIEFSGKL